MAPRYPCPKASEWLSGYESTPRRSASQTNLLLLSDSRIQAEPPPQKSPTPQFTMVLWHFTKSSQNRLDLFSLELPLTLSMAAGWGRRNRYKSRPLGSRFQQWRLWRPTRPLNIWFTNKNTLKCLKSFIPRFDDWKAFNIQDSGKFVHQPYLCPNMRLSSSAHWEISKYPSKRNADHCFVSRKSSSQPRLSETPTAFCPQWWVDIRIGMSFHPTCYPILTIGSHSTQP